MKRIEDLPEDAKNTVKRLIEMGYIEEVDGLVDITDEMAKLLLILDRADVFN